MNFVKLKVSLILYILILDNILETLDEFKGEPLPNDVMENIINDLDDPTKVDTEFLDKIYDVAIEQLEDVEIKNGNEDLILKMTDSVFHNLISRYY